MQKQHYGQYCWLSRRVIVCLERYFLGRKFGLDEYVLQYGALIDHAGRYSASVFVWFLISAVLRTWNDVMVYFRHGFVLTFLLLVSGCGPTRAPSFFLFGSYFPSWLIGVGLSIPFTLLIRWLLVRIEIDDVLPVRLLVYVCVAVMFTMAFAYLFSPR